MLPASEGVEAQLPEQKAIPIASAYCQTLGGGLGAAAWPQEHPLSPVSAINSRHLTLSEFAREDPRCPRLASGLLAEERISTCSIKSIRHSRRDRRARVLAELE